MGIKFGEIDVNQILENEYRIGVLEKTLEWILANNTGFTKQLSAEILNDIRKDIVKNLKKKYPNSGIELREENQ